MEAKLVRPVGGLGSLQIVIHPLVEADYLLVADGNQALSVRRYARVIHGKWVVVKLRTNVSCQGEKANASVIVGRQDDDLTASCGAVDFVNAD